MCIRDRSQDSVSNLAILPIESDIASSLYYNDLLADFTAIKTMKVTFLKVSFEIFIKYYKYILSVY